MMLLKGPNPLLLLPRHGPWSCIYIYKNLVELVGTQAPAKLLASAGRTTAPRGAIRRQLFFSSSEQRRRFIR